MDKEILNAIIQSIATILAVAVGFFFSIFTERRAWKRTKNEKTRETQLMNLLDLIYNIQNTMLLIDDIIITNNHFLENISDVSTTLIDIQMEEKKNLINESLIKIHKYTCDIKKDVLNLKVLKYNENNISIANECMHEIETIEKKQFKSILNNAIPTNTTHMLRNKLNLLIEVAESGLRQ